MTEAKEARSRPGLARWAWTAALLVVAGGFADAADHPTLVSVDGAMCSVCHEDLLLEKTSTHPPVLDDCTTCHEFDITDAGTTVAIAADDPDLCLMCHDDKSGSIEGSIASPHPPVADGCTTCHDPHATSVEPLLVSAPREICEACHESEPLADAHGGQLTENARCATCHAVHGSDFPKMLLTANTHKPFADGSCSGCHRAPFGDRIRLRTRGEKLCEACHGRFEEFDGGSRHLALEGERGRAGCLNCHDPHMSPSGALLVRSGPSLCEGCHSKLYEGATAETGHAAAAEDCLTCHVPHTSERARLLQMPSVELCVACHDPDDSDLRSIHVEQDLGRVDCTSCHDPHGTGNEHLLAEVVHPPVLEGCDTCHDGNEVMEDGESSLCLLCHDDIGESAAAATHPHPAMEMARCADCHNAHASAQPRLVLEPGGAVCVACHDDKAPGAAERSHQIIDLVGCQACHEPHGGEREGFLRAEANELCLSCHDSASVRIPRGEDEVKLLGEYGVPRDVAVRAAVLNLDEGHPVLGHRATGEPTKEELKRTDTTFEGELTCLTCHDPHKGADSGLFVEGVQGSLGMCVRCHPK